MGGSDIPSRRSPRSSGVNLLLDTHAAIWWWTEPDRISPRGRTHLAGRADTLFFSAASAYELAQKQRWRGLPLPADFLRNLESHLRAEDWQPLPVSLAHALRAGLYPSAHRDPFDRILAAQAEVEHLTLVTCDPAFALFGTRTLW